MSSMVLAERVTKVEEDVTHLAETLSNFRRENISAFQSLKEGLSSNFDRIERVVGDLQKRSQVSWQLIFACVSTLIGVASIAAVIHMQSLRPIQASLTDVSSDLQEHVELQGHPESRIAEAVLSEKLKAGTVRTADLAQRVEQLTTRLTAAETKLKMMGIPE